MFVKERGLQGHILDHVPIHIRANVGVFNGIGLYARHDFVPGAQRIAQKAGYLMRQG